MKNIKRTKFCKIKQALRFINAETLSLCSMRNRRRIVADYSSRRTLVRGNPCILHIEVTNKCNLDCKMCPRKHMEREEGFMDYSLFKKIIDDAKGKVEYVELYLFGEPLLHKRIFEMIRYCKDAGMYVALSTNATPLTKEKSHSLIDACIDFFTVSLDGVTEQTYEAIRTQASYRGVLSNIEYFLSNRTPRSPKHTVVQLIKMKDNAGEIDRFVDMWNRRGVQIHLKPLMTWRGDLDSINVLEQNQTRSSVLPKEPCDRLWRHFSVFWDGTVVPCHYMYDKKFVFGNIQDHSLLDLWNGDSFVDFRKQHIFNTRSSIPGCSKCHVQSLRGWELFAAIVLNTYALRSINTIFHYN